MAGASCYFSRKQLAAEKKTEKHETTIGAPLTAVATH